MGLGMIAAEYSKKKITKPQFVAQYGTLFEDFHVANTVWRKKYNSIFLLRRLLYAAILILTFNYPMIQYILLMAIFVIPVNSAFKIWNRERSML